MSETSGSDAGLNAKSVRELRAILQSRGVDDTDCIEKSDLVKKVADTAHLEPKPGAISRLSKDIGGVPCNIVQNSSNPDFVVILSHGFGANNEDLIPLATSVLEVPSLKQKKFCFVFPMAPVRLGQGGYGWWNIDLNELMQKAMSGQLESIMAETPKGLPEARQVLLNVIQELKKEYPSVPWSRFVLGGFSQGAIMSVDACLHLEEPVGAVVGWSGALMCKGEWEKLVLKKKGIKVFLSHGTQDPILPFMMGKNLEVFLKMNGAIVEFITFSGGHQIPQTALQKFVSVLESV